MTDWSTPPGADRLPVWSGSAIGWSDYTWSDLEGMILTSSNLSAQLNESKMDKLQSYSNGNLIATDGTGQGVDSGHKVGTASGDIPALSTGGKLAASMMPDISLSDYVGTPADQGAMLALTGQRGDWCIRSDTNTTYVLITDDPTQLGNWKAIVTPSSGVTSASGTANQVTVSAASGAVTWSLPSSINVTGITGTTWQIGTGGPLWKNSGGTLTARTSGDGADAPLWAADITSSGTIATDTLASKSGSWLSVSNPIWSTVRNAGTDGVLATSTRASEADYVNIGGNAPATGTGKVNLRVIMGGTPSYNDTLSPGSWAHSHAYFGVHGISLVDSGGTTKMGGAQFGFSCEGEATQNNWELYSIWDVNCAIMSGYSTHVQRRANWWGVYFDDASAGLTDRADTFSVLESAYRNCEGGWQLVERAWYAGGSDTGNAYSYVQLLLPYAGFYVGGPVNYHQLPTYGGGRVLPFAHFMGDTISQGANLGSGNRAAMLGQSGAQRGDYFQRTDLAGSPTLVYIGWNPEWDQSWVVVPGGDWTIVSPKWFSGRVNAVRQNEIGWDAVNSRASMSGAWSFEGNTYFNSDITVNSGLHLSSATTVDGNGCNIIIAEDGSFGAGAIACYAFAIQDHLGNSGILFPDPSGNLGVIVSNDAATLNGTVGARAVKLGTTNFTDPAVEGEIRFDGTNFKGYAGAAWHQFN